MSPLDTLTRSGLRMLAPIAIPQVRSLAEVARDLALTNASIDAHPGRHHYAPDAAQDAWLSLADRRLELEQEFRAALERDTGVNTALLVGAL